MMNIFLSVLQLLMVTQKFGTFVNGHFVDGHNHHDLHADHRDQTEHTHFHMNQETRSNRGLLRNASSPAIVFSSRSGHSCGTAKPTSDEMKSASLVVAKYMFNMNGRRDQQVTVQVQTYFHVITEKSKGNISDAVLQEQLTVLNDAFLPHGFSFRLMGTSRTTNSNWYTAGMTSSEQFDMKSTLRVGDASVLNVYFNNLSGDDLLGYATMPWKFKAAPEKDGVVVLFKSVPGDSLDSYYKGKILVHEVGHWLGLHHTFEADAGYFQLVNGFLKLIGLRNDCDGDGDKVKDTPAQRGPTYGCPKTRDSCPSKAGLDPIHNYMDYTDDRCKTEFTPGQGDRMKAMWNEYRS
jgi:Pregnancy-associated plasma protein-A